MGDTVQVPVGALLTHAATLDRLAGTVTEIHHAARQTRLDTAAYGQICGFLPAYFEPGTQATVDGLAGTADQLHAFATNLTNAAYTYGGADDGAAERLNITVVEVDL
jgi:hypothetical protein